MSDTSFTPIARDFAYATSQPEHRPKLQEPGPAPPVRDGKDYSLRVAYHKVFPQIEHHDSYYKFPPSSMRNSRYVEQMAETWSAENKHREKRKKKTSSKAAEAQVPPKAANSPVNDNHAARATDLQESSTSARNTKNNSAEGHQSESRVETRQPSPTFIPNGTHAGNDATDDDIKKYIDSCSPGNEPSKTEIEILRKLLPATSGQTANAPGSTLRVPVEHVPTPTAKSSLDGSRVDGDEGHAYYGDEEMDGEDAGHVEEQNGKADGDAGGDAGTVHDQRAAGHDDNQEDNDDALQNGAPTAPDGDPSDDEGDSDKVPQDEDAEQDENIVNARAVVKAMREIIIALGNVNQQYPVVGVALSKPQWDLFVETEEIDKLMDQNNVDGDLLTQKVKELDQARKASRAAQRKPHARDEAAEPAQHVLPPPPPPPRTAAHGWEGVEHVPGTQPVQQAEQQQDVEEMEQPQAEVQDVESNVSSPLSSPRSSMSPPPGLSELEGTGSSPPSSPPSVGPSNSRPKDKAPRRPRLSTPGKQIAGVLPINEQEHSPVTADDVRKLSSPKHLSSPAPSSPLQDLTQDELDAVNGLFLLKSAPSSPVSIKALATKAGPSTPTMGKGKGKKRAYADDDIDDEHSPLPPKKALRWSGSVPPPSQHQVPQPLEQDSRSPPNRKRSLEERSPNDTAVEDDAGTTRASKRARTAPPPPHPAKERSATPSTKRKRDDDLDEGDDAGATDGTTKGDVKAPRRTVQISHPTKARQHKHGIGKTPSSTSMAPPPRKKSRFGSYDTVLCMEKRIDDPPEVISRTRGGKK